MVLLAALADPVAAQAQDWNPFKEQAPPGSTSSPRRPPRPPGEARPPSQPPAEAGPPPGDAAADAARQPVGAPAEFAPREAVERSDLPPLTAGDEPQQQAPSAAASPVPPVAAEGDHAALAKLAADVEMPARSAALTRLLVGLLSSAPAAGEAPEAIGRRGMALYRAGRVREAHALVEQATPGPPETPAGHAMAALRARFALAAGDRERACSSALSIVQGGAGLPASIVGDAIVIQGYCSAAAGNPAAAGLAAGLGREQGGVSPAALAALEALAAGEAPSFAGTQRLGVVEWRLSEVSAKLDAGALPVERMDPATLVAAASSERAPGRLVVAAAEAAARINAIDPPALADVYRRQPFTVGDLAQVQTPGARIEPWARRAMLFKAAEAERTPMKRTRLVRAALDDARRAGIYVPMAAALARAVGEIRPVAEIGWFAETAIEVMLTAGRLDDARRWVALGAEPGYGGERAAGSLTHWLALIDIADPSRRGGRGASLASVEEIALRGRYTPDGLHRLATVLDALDFDVPVRLWEAASRAPQPTTGHLPHTGVLAELQDAARRRDTVRAAGLVVRALGPDGPEGAHMIALGDALRGLRRAGLEAEARAVAVEALFALWPRGSSS